MITGSLTLNGVDDAALVTILQEKEKSPGFLFNPQVMQVAQQPVRHPTQAPLPNTPHQRYNNVVLAWQDEATLKTVQSILHKIHPHHPA